MRFFTEAVKNETDIDDYQNNEDKLNSFEASQDHLGYCKGLIDFQVGLA